MHPPKSIAEIERERERLYFFAPPNPVPDQNLLIFLVGFFLLPSVAGRSNDEDQQEEKEKENGKGARKTTTQHQQQPTSTPRLIIENGSDKASDHQRLKSIWIALGVGVCVRVDRDGGVARFATATILFYWFIRPALL
jgi:hypothetical protein